MPKKKNNEESHHKNDPNVMGLRAEVQEQPICRTLEENYMPPPALPLHCLPEASEGPAEQPRR